MIILRAGRSRRGRDFIQMREDFIQEVDTEAKNDRQKRDSAEVCRHGDHRGENPETRQRMIFRGRSRVSLWLKH